MFETRECRLFALPPGVDFPAEFAKGLLDRLRGAPPQAMARVEIYLNSARMRRAVAEAFAAAGPGLLPRLRLVTDPGNDPVPGLGPAIPPLRRRLELAQLISRLLDAQPDIAPRSALYDLAESLAGLMDEMQGEGVRPEVLAALDVSGHSAHWARTQDFLSIVAPYFAAGAAPDAEARQRLVVGRMIARWQAAPPQHPVIVAGSTGSRGTTALLMQAVTRLPQGALVLPGFDFDLPEKVWATLDDALTAEDHPQFRYRRIFEMTGAKPADVAAWTPCPSFPRNRLVSLALRPAPVTDQWLTDGPLLPDLVPLTQGLSLIEAPGPRAEALAIALILREAVERGQPVALITPDRALSRQVVAALDRWGILPDDSAGKPLALSAPGRLLRHTARLFGRRISSEILLTLLKHPLTATGWQRGEHLRLTRDLELHLRRNGPVFPTGAAIVEWAAQQGEVAVVWSAWLDEVLRAVETAGPLPLAQHIARHLTLTEALAGGPAGGSGALWQREAGEAALATVDELRREADSGGILTDADYGDLLGALLARGEVREAVQGHPLVRILGPREAREYAAELVVLGGLNDGVWPSLPPPDPWLNRQMRQKAGLLLPERQIGLSAHDFQQAIAAPQVVLTRALRDAEAETVQSRWLNRLVNLMSGLPERNGPQALEAMSARGRIWLDIAQRLDAPTMPATPAHRPAPRPPVETRPKQLAVTGIRKLIRDPYAIYARHVLRLFPLDPLHPAPDALLRGSVLHAILECFVTERISETPGEARARLSQIADAVLAEQVPWPAARMLWKARLERAAPAFIARETASKGEPVVIEEKGKVALPDLGFTLTAKPDRIDLLPDGRLHILDYKTGQPPTQKQQDLFDKQLLLEAAMAERSGFPQLGPREVARITYVGFNAAGKVESTETTPELLEKVWHDLHRLIRQYQSAGQGYAARRAVFGQRFEGDYDHLARYGEWDMTDAARPEDVP
ncbi:MAG: double-strand break repair protein AddB [Cereibacter sphaeroides]|uniref:Double-strand break repair protein AddB n=1 Tax=Cereibacter sphaeroides TaxID=1063 RepID=A0A2W5U2Y5_CERSP|nr:MAG: double-strand break repair protein AddB [Cereibacter sphaeroides]